MRDECEGRARKRLEQKDNTRHRAALDRSANRCGGVQGGDRGATPLQQQQRQYPRMHRVGLGGYHAAADVDKRGMERRGRGDEARIEGTESEVWQQLVAEVVRRPQTALDGCCTAGACHKER